MYKLLSILIILLLSATASATNTSIGDNITVVNNITAQNGLFNNIYINNTPTSLLYEPIITTSTSNTFWNGLKQFITLSISNITGLQSLLDSINISISTHETTTTGIHGVGSGSIVGTGLTQNLTNKTLHNPVVTGELTLPGNPSNSLGATPKQYVDSLVSGLTWKDPVILMGLISDSETSPPVSPNVSDAYIVATGGSGGWSGLDGRLVEWSGSAWTDFGLLTIDDRLGISIETTTVASGTFASKNNQILTVASTSPYTYTYYVPTTGDSFFVSKSSSYNAFYGEVYGTDSEWHRFSRVSSIEAGTGISYSGNTLNINSADTNHIMVNADNIDVGATVILSTGSYSNPAWIVSIDVSKVSGAVQSVTANSPLSYSGTTNVTISDTRTSYPNSTVASKESTWDTVSTKEPTITGSTSNTFWNGLKQFVSLEVSNISGLSDQLNTYVLMSNTSYLKNTTVYNGSNIQLDKYANGSIFINSTASGNDEPVISNGLTTQFWNGLKQWITLGIGNITGLQGLEDTQNTSINNHIANTSNPHNFVENDTIAMTNISTNIVAWLDKYNVTYDAYQELIIALQNNDTVDRVYVNDTFFTISDAKRKVNSTSGGTYNITSSATMTSMLTNLSNAPSLSGNVILQIQSNISGDFNIPSLVYNGFTLTIQGEMETLKTFTSTSSSASSPSTNIYGTICISGGGLGTNTYQGMFAYAGAYIYSIRSHNDTCILQNNVFLLTPAVGTTYIKYPKYKSTGNWTLKKDSRTVIKYLNIEGIGTGVTVPAFNMEVGSQLEITEGVIKNNATGLISIIWMQGYNSISANNTNFINEGSGGIRAQFYSKIVNTLYYPYSVWIKQQHASSIGFDFANSVYQTMVGGYVYNSGTPVDAGSIGIKSVIESAGQILFPFIDGWGTGSKSFDNSLLSTALIGSINNTISTNYDDKIYGNLTVSGLAGSGNAIAKVDSTGKLFTNRSAGAGMTGVSPDGSLWCTTWTNAGALSTTSGACP